jgi:hypothetical protein
MQFFLYNSFRLPSNPFNCIIYPVITIANYLEMVKIPITSPDAVMVKINFIRSGKDVLAGQRNSLPGHLF